MDSEVISVADCDVVKCSNCNKDLMIVKGKDTKKDFVSKIQVDCPFCGDHSYLKEIKGTFLYNPALGVKLKSVEQKNDVMRFLTTK